jgi:hypothetical protein
MCMHLLISILTIYFPFFGKFMISPILTQPYFHVVILHASVKARRDWVVSLQFHKIFVGHMV